ncbi:MAG: pyruvate dehydrogenase complex dihydrolipoamide acetyltransferase [Saprospiraceae bacterium]|nr:pyruvate dehydrogenase complex dihydrolipoamide acetyltransferase [Saprospiraceae bacterium]
MAEIIRMPRMSDTMEEGNIVGWLKEVGDEVEPGDILAEVETDKATMELESYFEGTLLHIGIKEGPVPVNGVLAVIGEKGEDFQALLDQAEEPVEAPAEAVQAQSSNGQGQPVSTQVAEPAMATAAPAAASSSDARIKASPLARNMAQDEGIDLAALVGSGENGRIIKRDIEAAMTKGVSASPAAAPDTATSAVPAFTMATGEGNFQDTPLSQMRKIIARRLGESKFTAPHFYLTMEIDMSKAIEVRKSINEVAPTKISYNDMVVKASAAALQQHPAINSSWLDDRIRTNGNINIGVAVAVDEGLLVPVINHANYKSLSQINVEVKELAGKARERKLQPQEMSGNTFTISNLGMFGIDEFTAIINPPDSCILAVGGIAKKPVVVDGELAVGNIMKVTLSCDHRVVDGATGAKFLQTLKGILEDPIRMIV